MFVSQLFLQDKEMYKVNNERTNFSAYNISKFNEALANEAYMKDIFVSQLKCKDLYVNMNICVK